MPPWYGRVGRRAAPGVPIQARGKCLGLLGHADARTEGPVRAAMDFRDVAQHAAPDQLAEPAAALAAMPLVAQLRGDLLLSRELRQPPGLPDAVGQRLLGIDARPVLDGQHRSQKVMVVGRGDKYRVKVLVGIEQLAVIRVCPGLGVLRAGCGHAPFVTIGHGDEVLAAGHADMGAATTSNADQGRIELLVGCIRPCGAGRDDQERAGAGGGQKLAA